MASQIDASRRTEMTLRVMTFDAFIMLLLAPARICPAAVRIAVICNGHGDWLATFQRRRQRSALPSRSRFRGSSFRLESPRYRDQPQRRDCEGTGDPQAWSGGQLHSRSRSAIIRRSRLACSRSMLLSSTTTSICAVPGTAPAIRKKGFLSPRLPLIVKAIARDPINSHHIEAY
jgi:hypothetical protein